jgi:hypothetical protein
MIKDVNCCSVCHTDGQYQQLFTFSAVVFWRCVNIAEILPLPNMSPAHTALCFGLNIICIICGTVLFFYSSRDQLATYINDQTRGGLEFYY